MSPNILILDGHAEIYRDRLRAEFPALEFLIAHKASELPADISDVDVLLSFAIELKDDFYRRATALKWIQCFATGVDHVLRCPSLGAGVILTSGRGIHGPPMRETVVYLMMGVSRGAARLVADQRAHIWERRFWSLFYGKTAVVAGTGIVGGAIGTLLKAFGMHVVGVSHAPRAAEGFDEMLPMERLRDAARRADYLINVLPANAGNTLLFDGAVFAAMKPTGYYISAGRGQTVDEPALVAALR